MNRGLTSVRRPIRAVLAICMLGCCLLSGCNAIADEVIWLDRLPPSFREAAPDAPVPALDARS